MGQAHTVQYKTDLNETNWNFAAQINARKTNVFAILPANYSTRLPLWVICTM